MPGELNKIKKYINDLIKNDNSTKNIEQYAQYLTALQNLSNQIDRLSEVGEEGPYKMQDGDVAALRNCYNEVFLKQKAYQDYIKAQHLTGKDISEQNGIMAVVSDTLSHEYAGISGAVVETGMTYEQLLISSKKLEVSISGQQLGKKSGMQSTRIPLEFTTGDGKKVSGFFTEYTYPDFEKERKNLIEKYSKNSPEMAIVLRGITKTDKFVNSPFNLNMAEVYKRITEGLTSQNQLNGRMYQLLDRCCPRENIDRARAQVGEDFNRNILEFMQDFFHILGRELMQKNTVGMEKSDRVEDRNAAMSSVADLLGRPDLLARSAKMTVIVDGKPMEGVFMESAPGVDIRTLYLADKESAKHGIDEVNMQKVKDTDQTFQKNIDSVDKLSNENFLKSMADLQVIDMICGNIDRHNKNKLYQFTQDGDRQVLTGVVGIDNDLSFGTNNVEDYHSSRLPSISEMKCVSASMKKCVMGLSPEILTMTLKNYSLTDGEIKAAVGRLEAVKTAINDGKLKVIEDGQWENIKKYIVPYKDLPKGNTGNYFNLSDKLEASVFFEGQDQAAGYEYDLYCEKYKDLPKKSSSEKAYGEAIAGVDEAVIKASVEKLTLLEHEMDLKDIFYGSSAYDKVHASLKRVISAAEKIGPGADIYEYKKLQKAYEKLNKNVSTYLNKKTNEERELAKRGKKPSATARERMGLIGQISDYADLRLSGMKDMFNEKYTVESLSSELNKDSDRLFNVHFNATDFAIWEVKLNAKLELKANENLKITADSIYESAEYLMKQPFFKNLAEKYEQKNAVVTPEIFSKDLHEEIKNYNEAVEKELSANVKNKVAIDDMGPLFQA